MKRILAASAALAAVVVIPAAGLSQAADLDCSDFRTPVKIVNGYDPNHLDLDGDGVGCESNPGDPTAVDWYSDLRDPADTKPSELAHTGLGPTEHPVRWMVGSGGLIVLGGAAVVWSRKRKES